MPEHPIRSRVQKLHLVGFTTDQDGLILSARKGARSGGYTLVLDDNLAQAVEELRAKQEEQALAEGRAAAADRVHSRLPVSEIQARLRRGRSLKEVAKEAGVDPEWVERFAAPVFAEQAEVIARVQAGRLQRARLGPSAVTIGDALTRNLAERDVLLSPDEMTRAWTTHQRADGRWVVRFSFPHRGKHRTLRFEVRPNGDIVAGDAFTSQLAYVAPSKRRPAPRPKPAPNAPDLSAKRAIVTTGYRAEPASKAVSRPAKERERAALAMQKAAGRRALEAERAAARKAREREQAIAQRERQARIEAQARAKEAAARAREAAAKARLEAAEQAERDRAAAEAAAKRQAERDAARRAARLKVKVAAKEAAKKATSGTKASGSAAAAKRAASGPSSTRKAAAGASARSRAASSGTDRRSSAPAASASTARARPSNRPSPDARVHAAPPRSAASRTPTERPTERPPATAPRPTSTPRPVAPSTGAPSTPQGAARRRPVDAPGGDASRALFRAGLADPTDDTATQAVPAVRQPPAATNGDTAATPPVARPRPPGVRRTRPLRAS
jgi:hypothetical protein